MQKKPQRAAGSGNFSKPNLIIVADDFGVNPDRTDGIVEACIDRPPAVSQVSLLVNGEDSKRAAGLARQWNIAVGLHFNISEGKPVSDPSKLPTLVGSDGLFRGKAAAYRLLLQQDTKGRPQLESEIQLELLAQLALFKELCGFPAQHLDSHHHVHVTAPVWNAIENLCNSDAEPLWQSIRSVRMPSDGMFTSTGPSQPEDTTSWDFTGEGFWSLVSHAAVSIVKSSPALRSGRLFCSTSFIGLDIMGANLTQERLELRLRTAVSRSARHISAEEARDFVPVIEIMTHVGNSCTAKPSDNVPESKFWRCPFSQSTERLQEKEIYRSVASQLHKRFLITNYQAVVRRREAVARAKRSKSNL